MMQKHAIKIGKRILGIACTLSFALGSSLGRIREVGVLPRFGAPGIYRIDATGDLHKYLLPQTQAVIIIFLIVLAVWAVLGVVWAVLGVKLLQEMRSQNE